LLARHPRLARYGGGRISPASEEIVSSILGAIVCQSGVDRDVLLAKATFELVSRGEDPDESTRQIRNLWNHLRALL
jgi:hypothetical protein